jgi:ring-1,2-phenylacetyl-CoA epoxidase subunit PaaE
MFLYKPLHITKVIPETPDVKTFVIESREEAINYNAGQYLTFVFESNGHEIRRSYSLASSPVLNEPLAITVKRVQNGEVSRPLFDHAKEGDVLMTTGAGGFFVLPDQLSKDQQLFFLAAGSGIVPVYSLIKTALYTHPGVPVVLIYSNRSGEDTIWYEELKALQEKFKENFRIEFLFSMSADLLRARLNQSLLQILVGQHAIAQTANILFYLCGPFAYMRMIEIELQTMGFPISQIRKEQFATVRPVFRPQPPDTDPHTVEIRIGNELHRITVQYPLTILEAAKRKGIILPYSCEAGKCGSCAATCLQGKVWMMYNEVLLDDDLQKGLVLTCSGFPVGGNIVLKFD